MTRQFVGLWDTSVSDEEIAAAFAALPPSSTPSPDGVAKRQHEFRLDRIVKSVPTKVFGWASVSFTADGRQVTDLQGHEIDPDELEEAAYAYVGKEVRPSGEMHKSGPKGRLIESMVLTPEKAKAMNLGPGAPIGWWVGFEMPPEVITKVLSGEYAMFSIEGRGKLIPVEEP
jgi:hypothetical protein